ncbi:MAG: SOS response-associated peptidase [Methanoregula sp.]|nr:SOS response-associated peptidase [Methanoregula sp.]
MCGRYSLVCIDDLGNRFRVHNPMIGARSRFNIAPGNEMPVITRAGGNTTLALMTWGLVPHGTTPPASSPAWTNARAESLDKKAMFRPLLATCRCLVPASGFFEWKTEGKRKVPFWFRLPAEPLFAFAGLCDTWQGPGGQRLSRYTIITCEPNGLVSKVHNRMPAILTREQEGRWIAEDPLPPGALRDLLGPYPVGEMEMVPVTDLVNNPAIDDKRVIQPRASSAGTQTFLPV